MYKLIGSPATRALRVIWMLEELELPYEIEPARPRSPEVLARNPSGKVPILEVEGALITDSAAICQFLADRHERFTHPAGGVQRALQDAWTHFALEEFDSPLWTNAKHSFIVPEEMRSAAARAVSQEEFRRGLASLEARLGDRTFAMGDDFTVPDLLLGHCAGWAVHGANWEIPPGRAADYFERVRARPACQRALDVRARYAAAS